MAGTKRANYNHPETMLKRITIPTLLSGAILLLALPISSCTSPEHDVHISQELSRAQGSIDSVPTLVSVQTNASREVDALVLSLDVDFEAEGQSLRANPYQEDAETSELKPVEVNAEETAHCIIRKKGDPDATIYANIVWRGRGSNRLKLDNIRIPSDKKIDRSGQWYLTAIIGGSSFDLNTGRLSMGGKSSQEGKLSIDGTQVAAPYILAWSRLELPDNSQIARLPAKVRFRPHGAILRLQFNSDMVEDYKARRLKISTNAWRDTGILDPMAVEDDALDSANPLPLWTAEMAHHEVVTRTYRLGDTNTTAQQAAQGLILPAGAGWSPERTVYAWGMPTEVEQASTSTTIEVEVEAVETNDMRVPQYVVTYSKQRHRPLKSGRTYKLSNVLTSDLIISEVFYDYALPEAPTQRNSPRYNFAIVEIYNPTTTPIDLADYALARVVRQPSQGYIFYAPHQPLGSAAPNDALLLPLSTITGQAPPKTPFGGNIAGSLPRMGKYEGEWYQPILRGSNTGNSTILAPGKTILIGGPGYVRTKQDPKSNLLAFEAAIANKTLPDHLFSVKSLSDPAYQELKQAVQHVEEQTAIPRAGGQIDSAYRRRYTQGFIAIDNSITPGGNSRAQGSAVLDLAPDQGLVLVKYDSNARAPKVVDAAAPVLQGAAVAAAFDQQRLTRLNEGYDSYDWVEIIDWETEFPYSLVRARGHNFATAWMHTEPGAWYFERSENGGRKSLGTRDYIAGRSPYASAWAGYTALNNPKRLPFWREVEAAYSAPPQRQWQAISSSQAGGVYNDSFEHKQDELRRQSKLKVLLAQASSQHSASPIANAIDGQTDGATDQTIYHSRWGRNDLPVLLDFFFAQTEQIGSMTYYPRRGGNDNGNFQEVEILYSPDGRDYTLLQKHVFDGSKAVQEVAFKQVVSTGAIRLRVLSGVNGFAAASEIEFYRSTYKPNAYEALMMNLFTDKACTTLRPDLTREQIQSHPDPFLRDIALRMHEHKYPREFRIDDFEAYPNPNIQANELKTFPYSLHDNPTGISVKKGETLVVFVGDTHGHSGLELRIQNLDRPNGDGFGGRIYPLKEGKNAIKIQEKGLVYVNYLTQTLEQLQAAKPITIHFATGTVNGYFDSQRESHRGRWRELLSKATDRYFDLIGAHTHMTYETNDFRRYTPDGLALADVADKIVVAEMEHLGLYKYNRVRKNRAYMHVMYHAFMYATHHHTAYVYNTMERLASAEGMQDAWGPYHEIGHTNQTRGLIWKGMTECTVNIFSFYVMHNIFKRETRMIGENRYQKAWNGLLRRNSQYLAGKQTPEILAQESHASSSTDVFGKLVPFIQLELYFGNVLGRTPAIQTSDKGGFYPDLYEYLRVNATNEAAKRAPGYEQSEFAFIASRVAGYDLTDFFDKWGFLAPVDIEIDDYGKGRLTVTKERAQEVRHRIKALNKPKLNIALEYITERNIELYRAPRAIIVGQASRRDRTIGTKGFSHVVAYEVVDASGQIVHVEYGDKTSWLLPRHITWADGYRIFAVDATGKRTKLAL